MVLFLKTVFQERIWGGNALTQFGYDIPSDQTGECWAISAHQNGPNVIENGKHRGKTLMRYGKKIVRYSITILERTSRF